jgi:hypothetical protein
VASGFRANGRRQMENAFLIVFVLFIAYKIFTGGG